MTLYARSDVRAFTNPTCPSSPHVADEDDEHFALTCPNCEPIARRAKAVYTTDQFDIPKTAEEIRRQRKREEDEARRLAAIQVEREKMLLELADERRTAEKTAKAGRTRKAAEV